MEKAYSTAEVAKLLDVQGRTVRDWIKHGTIKAFKFNGRWRINESELRRIRQGAETND